MSGWQTAQGGLWLVLLVSAGLLAGALLFEHVGGLAPCPLCLAQRWALWAAAGLAGAGLLAATRGPHGAEWQAPLLGGAVAALLMGAATAGFHAGVEQGWWPGLAFCGGIDQTPLTLDSIGAALGGSIAAPRCDEIPWSLFGLSMAAYNLLISLATGGLALWALGGEMRPARPQEDIA